MYQRKELSEMWYALVEGKKVLFLTMLVEVKIKYISWSEIPEELAERADDLSDAEDDIPEDIPGDEIEDLTQEVEYADDFEEYASDEVILIFKFSRIN